MLTERLLSVSLLGAEWVLWLLLATSVVSVGIMIERWLVLRKAPARLSTRVLQAHESWAVAMATKEHPSKGGELGLDAYVEGLLSEERLILERHLAFLGTVGANAPFVGLLGTVLGIIRAFHDLSRNAGGGAGAVMAGISEALVATAVGLLVAIPAVIAYNYFQSQVQTCIVSALAYGRTRAGLSGGKE